MKLYWSNCDEVEREHECSARQYAHVFHKGARTICVAKAFWKLPKSYRDGIISHEIGHILAGRNGNEQDANRMAREVLGARIRYQDSPYGKRLERLINMPQRARNPIANHDLPYDQWIPSHAVKFNSDGTISLMAEGISVANSDDLHELIYNKETSPSRYKLKRLNNRR